MGVGEDVGVVEWIDRCSNVVVAVVGGCCSVIVVVSVVEY